MALRKRAPICRFVNSPPSGPLTLQSSEDTDLNTVPVVQIQLTEDCHKQDKPYSVLKYFSEGPLSHFCVNLLHLLLVPTNYWWLQTFEMFKDFLKMATRHENYHLCIKAIMHIQCEKVGRNWLHWQQHCTLNTSGHIRKNQSLMLWRILHFSHVQILICFVSLLLQNISLRAFTNNF